MKRAYYSNTISDFLNSPIEVIIEKLVYANEFSLEKTQRDTWYEEIRILQQVLLEFNGTIYSA